MAHTRFNFDWTWNGEETVIMSRCTDDQGEVQPTLAELNRNWAVVRRIAWNRSATLTTGMQFNRGRLRRTGA